MVDRLQTRLVSAAMRMRKCPGDSAESFARRRNARAARKARAEDGRLFGASEWYIGTAISCGPIASSSGARDSCFGATATGSKHAGTKNTEGALARASALGNRPSGGTTARRWPPRSSSTESPQFLFDSSLLSRLPPPWPSPFGLGVLRQWPPLPRVLGISHRATAAATRCPINRSILACLGIFGADRPKNISSAMNAYSRKHKDELEAYNEVSDPMAAMIRLLDNRPIKGSVVAASAKVTGDGNANAEPIVATLKA
ncbi:unnamed protein product [Prorocentrum cordatum]|uniref:Uncharacterized protein n=1 Tax=Prorocentrum cordatum TaxID=2364126 RepID=A0ABN9QP27_9DINO|nr:unnamed protein product [Polarella glacialis]